VRVVLDTTYARRAPYSGTAVYLQGLARALSELGGVEVAEVYNRRRRPPGGGGLASVGNALADRWWVEIELPRLAAATGADVIHHPLPAHSRAAATPQVITVHDLAFERLPDRFDRAYRAYARSQHRAAARQAAAVICVSETTAADLRELWGISAERIVIAPHGPGQELPAPARRTRPADHGERPHFLYVGDDEPRKNLATLLEGYAGYRESERQPLDLVLAGTASGGAPAPGIRREHRPGPERLARLYADAVALVHPALYEGFGMTPLEAMRIGTPVIAAAAPGVSEVCGDAARYVDPRDPRALAAAMAELAASETLRARLAERGRRRAAAYSWAASARRHLDAYSLARSR
jgi:glycosyltransferase involved in cell wall biosynthesis